MRCAPTLLLALALRSAAEDPLALNDPLRQLIVDTDVQGQNILTQMATNRPAPETARDDAAIGPADNALEEFLRGSDPKIVPQLEAFLRKHPGSARGWEHLGSLYFRQQRYAEALEKFEHAYRLDPGRPTTLNNYAACNIAVGRLDRARELLFQLLTVRPDDHPARFNLACLHAKQGRPDACIRELEKLEMAAWNGLSLHVTDSDLDSMRSHPAFIALQTRIRARERPVPIQR